MRGDQKRLPAHHLELSEGAGVAPVLAVVLLALVALVLGLVVVVVLLVAVVLLLVSVVLLLRCGHGTTDGSRGNDLGSGGRGSSSSSTRTSSSSSTRTSGSGSVGTSSGHSELRDHVRNEGKRMQVNERT